MKLIAGNPDECEERVYLWWQALGDKLVCKARKGSVKQIVLVGDPDGGWRRQVIDRRFGFILDSSAPDAGMVSWQVAQDS